MPKYSVESSSSASDDGTACELCGAEDTNVSEAEVAGATLLVCNDCSPHDDSQKTDSSTGNNSTREKNIVSAVTEESATLWEGDTERWEKDGAGYVDDPLPYLVNGYGTIVTDAREEKEVSVSELAESIAVPETDLLAIERGQAAQSNVTGSAISELESALNIEIVDGQ